MSEDTPSYTGTGVPTPAPLTAPLSEADVRRIVRDELELLALIASERSRAMGGGPPIQDSERP